jgi:hypothetical protein
MLRKFEEGENKIWVLRKSLTNLFTVFTLITASVFLRG